MLQTLRSGIANSKKVRHYFFIMTCRNCYCVLLISTFSRLNHLFPALSKNDADNRSVEHPVLFQSPRTDPIFVGDDLEMLYLEEIDVSDSHDYNSSISSEVQQDRLASANRQKQNSTNEVASPRQTLFPRTPRIFPPQTLSLTTDGNMANFEVSIQKQQTGVFKKKSFSMFCRCM